MAGLDYLPGGLFQSAAYSASADGSVVVGYGTTVNGNEAIRWDPTHGMQSLKALLLRVWIFRNGTSCMRPGLAPMVRPSVPSTPSSVSIPLDLGEEKISTTKSKLVIKGKATGTVTKVTYRIGKGAFKPAKGNTSWKFTAKLKPGRNKITVTATGPGGSSTPAKVIVTRK